MVEGWTHANSVSQRLLNGRGCVQSKKATRIAEKRTLSKDVARAKNNNLELRPSKATRFKARTKHRPVHSRMHLRSFQSTRCQSQFDLLRVGTRSMSTLSFSNQPGPSHSLCLKATHWLYENPGLVRRWADTRASTALSKPMLRIRAPSLYRSNVSAKL